MEPVPPERMPGERKLNGLVAYETALDDLIANTTQTLRIFDRNIGRAFNAPQRADILRELMLASRTNRVYIVLHETANIVRDCPRLMLLLKQFSYGVFIHQTLPAARRVYDPFAIGDDTRFVHRFHYNDVRGVATIGDIAYTSLLLKRFEEIWGGIRTGNCSDHFGLVAKRPHTVEIAPKTEYNVIHGRMVVVCALAKQRLAPKLTLC